MKRPRYPASPDGYRMWINDCRDLVRSDRDNLILYTGPEGEGKSTLAVQQMVRMDSTFGVERICFGIPAFIAGAKRTPKFGAVLGDEMLANRRHWNSRDLKDLGDFFQRCRGLNLHMGICFPHSKRLDRPIWEDRIRWQVEIPSRGHMLLSERVMVTRWVRGVKETEPRYVERGRWRVAENSNDHPLWSAYQLKKNADMRSEGIDVEALPVAEGDSGSGFDEGLLTGILVATRAKAKELGKG